MELYNNLKCFARNSRETRAKLAQNSRLSKVVRSSCQFRAKLMKTNGFTRKTT